MVSKVRSDLALSDSDPQHGPKPHHIAPEYTRTTIDTLIYTENVAGSIPAPPTKEINALGVGKDVVLGRCGPLPSCFAAHLMTLPRPCAPPYCAGHHGDDW
jgi:hypothetical protein